MLLDDLAVRIRGEYAEMPGLRLTVPQACRLWQLDRPTCEGALEALVRDGFLLRTDDGAFVASSTRAARRAGIPLGPRAHARE